MMAKNSKVDITSFVKHVPMIYAYTTPGVSYHDGWLKIGSTSSQTVEERIKNQTGTADIIWKLEWQDNAMYKDGSGEYFTDHKFHDYLTNEKGIERNWPTEWFKIDPNLAYKYFVEFTTRKIPIADEHNVYYLRDEQNVAINKTKEYFERGGTEFLWNAKPRFGKTYSAYGLIELMRYKRVLIVTNRPSVANPWADFFYEFMSWKNEYCFVSDNDALKNKKGILTRDQYLKSGQYDKGLIAFESLQGLKSSIYFGGSHDTLQWLASEYVDGHGEKQHGIQFDLLIVDEAQEGVETMRTERAFENINRKHTLYLSGTPFKALASDKFDDAQIFNWSYADEQAAKANWCKEESNPYEEMPRLTLYSYQLSDMIFDEIQKGIDIDDETIEYAFDLNEFFETNERGTFVHEDDVKKFLQALTTQEKYPFSTPELRYELSHTLWLLNRVNSAKALAKLLQEDPIFSEYEIVLAAGDGKIEDDDEIQKSYNKVKDAIAHNEKTITLSVGQLTVGVTIPEWSGVLMLCNLQSASSYMQAAFRAQNPCSYSKNGALYTKETSYIFDFDPARTLIIYDEFANNLSLSTIGGRGTEDARKENIRRLLNFFPVLAEDDQGEMVELNDTQVLSIPRRIKCKEVVRRGFMSNFLFQNISNIFGAPHVVEEILNKLPIAHEESDKSKREPISGSENVKVDENGEAKISNEIIIGKTQDIFGDKYYEKVGDIVSDSLLEFSEACNNETDSEKIERQSEVLKNKIKEALTPEVVNPLADAYGTSVSETNRLKKQVDNAIDKDFYKIQDSFIQQTKIAKNEHDKSLVQARTEEEVEEINKSYKQSIKDAFDDFSQNLTEMVESNVNEKPKELVTQLEHNKAEKERINIEDKVRDHLRGFSRTIPSFIMAYGDENLTLANFDTYVEPDVFEEVTGITIEDFRFLRDGGDYIDSETGKTEYFAGHLFDEVVFNDSIKEFLNKKRELANYFDENQKEDIFDYIPPQKTNQIFTPRNVVIKMVDELEEENPGCFDNPDYTFADLYMKSGLYITEIVKRLYKSERIKSIYPNDKERINHILTKQVYGMAPTRIIYLIATNYILGFDETLKINTHNFVQADAAEASKNGTLTELVNKYFSDYHGLV